LELVVTLARFLLIAIVIGLVPGAIHERIVEPSVASAVPPIGPDQFSKLHALIKPKADEAKWEEIPWLASLWEARQKAAAQGKPILLWEMDGHPLGCV
jgi:hypothetical protein